LSDDPIVRYEIVFHGSIFCRDVRPNAILDIPPELREVDIEGVLEEFEPTHGGDIDGPESDTRGWVDAFQRSPLFDGEWQDHSGDSNPRTIWHGTSGG
jgi:hypothetical protein